MRYYICYDKSGAFLGGLTHKKKPANKNCKEVSEAEYRNILALNGIVLEEPAKEPADTSAEEQTEETVEEPVEEA